MVGWWAPPSLKRPAAGGARAIFALMRHDFVMKMANARVGPTFLGPGRAAWSRDYGPAPRHRGGGAPRHGTRHGSGFCCFRAPCAVKVKFSGAVKTVVQKP